MADGLEQSERILNLASEAGHLLLQNGAEISRVEETMERIATYYGERNECCGGYTVLDTPRIAEKRSRAVYTSAKNAGADMIVTACPLCRYNLIKNGADIPVIYFTEMLWQALSE